MLRWTSCGIAWDLQHGLLGDWRDEVSCIFKLEEWRYLLLFARSLIQVAVRTSDRSTAVSCTHAPCPRSLLGARQPWFVWPEPYSASGGVLDFEELTSEPIARAQMLRPHLVSAPPTFGAHRRTLSAGEKRCGRMIANPVKSTCTSITSQLSERAGADACL